jgi:hypothetical protein
MADNTVWLLLKTIEETAFNNGDGEVLMSIIEFWKNKVRFGLLKF